MLEEIVKRSSLQPRRLQDLTCEWGVPRRLTFPAVPVAVSGWTKWPTLCNLLSPVLAPGLPHKSLCSAQTAIITPAAFGC